MANESKILMSSEFAKGIAEILGIALDDVASIVIEARHGLPVSITVTHIADERLLDYDWAKLKPNTEGTKPDAE